MVNVDNRGTGPRRGSGSMWFILGAIVVAVLIIGWFLYGGEPDVADIDDPDVNVTTEGTPAPAGDTNITVEPTTPPAGGTATTPEPATPPPAEPATPPAGGTAPAPQ